MDRVIETPDGFDCIVNGRTFGTWATWAIAKAGMKVQQDRDARRLAEQRAEMAETARLCDANQEEFIDATETALRG